MGNVDKMVLWMMQALNFGEEMCFMRRMCGEQLGGCVDGGDDAVILVAANAVRDVAKVVSMDVVNIDAAVLVCLCVHSSYPQFCQYPRIHDTGMVFYTLWYIPSFW